MESTNKLDLLREALEKLLYVPLKKIKLKVIDEIVKYFMKKQDWIENENFKFFYALSGNEIKIKDYEFKQKNKSIISVYLFHFALYHMKKVYGNR